MDEKVGEGGTSSPPPPTSLPAEASAAAKTADSHEDDDDNCRNSSRKTAKNAIGATNSADISVLAATINAIAVGAGITAATVFSARRAAVEAGRVEKSISALSAKVDRISEQLQDARHSQQKK